MNPKKPVVFLLGSALGISLGIREARENPHVETRQYEEPSTLSYELTLSTATASVTSVNWLLPDDLKSPKFRVIL